MRFIVIVICVLCIAFIAKLGDVSKKYREADIKSFNLEKENEELQKLVDQAELNDKQTIGDIIHNKQFDCAMEINDENEPQDFDGLPDEMKTMCKTLEKIDLYYDDEGSYYFAKSSGVPQ